MAPHTTMFTLLTLHPMANYLMRPSLAPLCEFVAAEHGLSLAQKATLLAAFFPAFIPSQLVASVLIQRYGAKAVSTVQNAGIALALLACPWAMRAGGHLGLAACFTAIGVFQSPLFPALSVLKRTWTAGVEPAKRALLLRVFSMGQYVANFSAAFFTPLLASKYGWQAVPYTFGSLMAALTVVWHFGASDAPPVPIAAAGDAKPAAPPVGTAPRKPSGLGISWDIFSVNSVQACIFQHISHNTVLYTLMQWCPTYYIETFGVPRAEIGRWLAIPSTVNIWGGFLIGAIEVRCLRSGMPQLQSALSLVMFTFAPTATTAMLVQCAIVLSGCYSGSGFGPNYYEIGGGQTAVLSAVGNVFASVPGLVLPLVGVALRQYFGNFKPIFMLAGAVMLVSGHFYGAHCSVESAEDTLAQRRDKLLPKHASSWKEGQTTGEESATPTGPRAGAVVGSGNSMSWVCLASDEGSRLERLLRDKCRDLDPARRLSNRLLKDAIRNGEAKINSDVCMDKSRVLHEGDVVELVYNRARASDVQRSSNKKLLQIEHEDPDLAIVWKPAGVNRDLEEAIDQELGADGSGSGGLVKPEVAYRLAKGIAGLLVVAKTERGRQLTAASKCCFRVLVYGRLDTKGQRLPSSALPQGPATSESGVEAVGSDGDDEDADAGAAGDAAQIAAKRAAAMAQNRVDDDLMAASIAIRTIPDGLTRCNGAGYMSKIDVWCDGWSSGGKHKRALCRHLTQIGHPVVGDERANHAWVKKKGLHLALLSVELSDADEKAIVVTQKEPTKFGHTANREAKFFQQSLDRQTEPEPEPGSPKHTAEEEDGEFVSSTLGLANRVNDLALVVTHLQVPEDGAGGELKADAPIPHLWERGKPAVDNATGTDNSTADIKLLAMGYRRILLGDHGPYFELEKRHLNLAAFNAYPPRPLVHYIEHLSASGAKLYEQLRTVAERPNPPKEGRFWVANDRPEGYADYKIGMYYLSCDQVQVTMHRSVGHVQGLVEEVESAAMVEIGGGRSRQIPLDHEQRKDLARDAQQRRLRRVD